MKIEFTRTEIEQIILDHIKNEIVPYVNFLRNEDNEWGLPDIITVEAEE